MYSYILTSCFLDTVLVPLCTWLYLTALIILAITGARLSSQIPHESSNSLSISQSHGSKNTRDVETNELATGGQTHRRAKIHKALSILYYLFLLAQFLMCVLEIVRLSLTHLSIGLLPFTFVVLITAAAVHFTQGLGGKIYGWSYLNLALWIGLTVTNGVKLAEESKEGTGARKGSKYPVADEITDVSVMVGVYAVLTILETVLNGMRTARWPS
ncbi:MAG: hypothetical protein Q9212_006747 [Teloschistes hypoglaucus]